MNSNTFRMPVRRTAAAATVVALAVGPVVLAAPAAHATGGEGRATAAVLRTGLDVSLLNSVHVPLRASLNDVQAPADADRTALTVTLDGVEQGRPVNVLRADVATARATVDGTRAEGRTHLVKARVHVPGLPALALIEVEKVTSKAVCEAGKRPVAESNVLGHVRVLGKRITLSSAGRTEVTVPGVGKVTLDLSRTATTSRTAAATALELKVAVNPLDLNVAKVTGTVTLAEATCETPKGTRPTEKPTDRPTEKPTKEPSGRPTDGGGVETQNGGSTPTDQNLAETGGSSTTPYLAGGAALLLGVGGGALVLARIRARG
ncbi:SCO1860 family LAETG-anchored protein [Streptomyces sp. NPDC093600]|uniref:SCO1860 family LAETG-anchored protein n=1 Tax=Streptomyces sp. NPDC093600 TaxID=3366047 RepID=UPI0037F49D14